MTGNHLGLGLLNDFFLFRIPSARIVACKICMKKMLHDVEMKFNHRHLMQFEMQLSCHAELKEETSCRIATIGSGV